MTEILFVLINICFLLKLYVQTLFNVYFYNLVSQLLYYKNSNLIIYVFMCAHVCMYVVMCIYPCVCTYVTEREKSVFKLHKNKINFLRIGNNCLVSENT